jgi:hypothetical protein
MNKLKILLIIQEPKIWDVVTLSKEVDVLMELILQIVFMKMSAHKELTNVRE